MSLPRELFELLRCVRERPDADRVERMIDELRGGRHSPEHVEQFARVARRLVGPR